MSRLRNYTAAGLLALVASLMSAGCVDNDSSLYIAGVFDLSQSNCIAEPDGESVILANGVIDLMFARSYTAALLVGSQLTPRGSRENLRTETSRLAVEGVHVTLYGTDGGETSFDTAANGIIHPASGTDPGIASVFAQLIRPEDVGADPANRVYGVLGPPGQAIARVRVYGTTLGGQQVESGDFDFTIHVCRGCLVTYPANAKDPAVSMPYLCSPDSDAASESTDICFLGQDNPVPCTACVSFSEICRDPERNPAYTSADD
jgi:hypothetical protein